MKILPGRERGVISLVVLGTAFLIVSLISVTAATNSPFKSYAIQSWAKAQKTWRDIGSPRAGRHAGKVAEQEAAKRAAESGPRPCLSGCSESQVKDTTQTIAGKLGSQYSNGDVAGFYQVGDKYYPISESAGGPSTGALNDLLSKNAAQVVPVQPQNEAQHPNIPEGVNIPVQPAPAVNTTQAQAGQSAGLVPQSQTQTQLQPNPQPVVNPVSGPVTTVVVKPNTPAIQTTKPSQVGVQQGLLDNLSGAVQQVTQPQQPVQAVGGNGSFVYYSQLDSKWDGIPTEGKATIEADGCGIITGAMVTKTDPYVYWNNFSTYFKSQGKERLVGTGGTAFDDHRDVLQSMGYKMVPVTGSVKEIKQQITNYTKAGTPVWVNAYIYKVPHHTEAIGVSQDGNIVFNDPVWGKDKEIPDKYIDEGTNNPWRVFAVVSPK